MDVRRVSLFKLVEESAIEALFAAEDDYIYFSRSRSRCVMRSVPESTLRRDFVNRTFLLGTIRTFSFGGDTQDLSLSPQSEKFLLQQNEKFLLTTGKMAGWKRRSCCSRSEIGID